MLRSSPNVGNDYEGYAHIIYERESRYNVFCIGLNAKTLVSLNFNGKPLNPADVFSNWQIVLPIGGQRSGENEVFLYEYM